MIDRDALLVRAATRVGPDEGFLKVRCSEILSGLAPASEALEVLAERGGPLRVIDAEEMLGVLDDLHMLATPAADPLCEYLIQAQHSDGSWSREGDDGEDATILATAMIAGHLGKTRCVRPACLESAGRFLALRWSPDRVQGFVWDSVAAWAHFFANVPHALSDEGLQWCGRELERGYRAGRFDAASCARVLIWCDGAALPGGHLDAAELFAAIVAIVESDPTPAPVAGATEGSGGYDTLVALARLP
jgi:hypothetical protein